MSKTTSTKVRGTVPTINLGEEVSRATQAVLENVVTQLSGRVYSPRIKLLGINQVCEATGLGERTIYTLISSGKFPRPLSDLGKNCWRESTLIAWMDAHDPDGRRDWTAGTAEE